MDTLGRQRRICCPESRSGDRRAEPASTRSSSARSRDPTWPRTSTTPTTTSARMCRPCASATSSTRPIRERRSPRSTAAISDSVSDARSTNVVGMAGDMLGYYYQRGDYTDQEFGSSDFERFNVGPNLAQDNADLGTANAAALGFATSPDRDGVRAPRRHRRGQAGRAVLSRSGRVIGSDDQLLRIVGQVTGRRRSTSSATSHGTSTTARPDTTASKERFDHTFPGPGTYDVTATVTGSNAKTRSWTQTIVIDPPLAAKRRAQTYRSNKKAQPRR